MKEDNFFFSAKYVAYLGVLAALVIGFQVLSGFMHIGQTTFCLVLVPIVLGGMLLGIAGGVILGLIFGFMVIFDAIVGLDAFTLYLMGTRPIFVVFICLGKGAAAGLFPALAFKLLKDKNKYVAIILACILAPVFNSGVFGLGCFFIIDDIMSYIGISGSGYSSAYVIFTMLIGINFFVELGINIVLTPAIYSVERVVSKRLQAKRGGYSG